MYRIQGNLRNPYGHWHFEKYENLYRFSHTHRKTFRARSLFHTDGMWSRDLIELNEFWRRPNSIKRPRMEKMLQNFWNELKIVSRHPFEWNSPNVQPLAMYLNTEKAVASSDDFNHFFSIKFMNRLRWKSGFPISGMSSNTFHATDRQ